MPRFPQDELHEPLQSITQDIASEPVPESLISRAAERFAGPLLRRNESRRAGLAVILAGLALGLCIAALVVTEEARQGGTVTFDRASSRSHPEPEPTPPPSLWAYRRAAESPEALDDLLTRHAEVLLPEPPADRSQTLNPLSWEEVL